MEKWEYGRLSIVWLNHPEALVSVARYGGGRREVLEGVTTGIDALNRVGQDGWVVHDGRPSFGHLPDWLATIVVQTLPEQGFDNKGYTHSAEHLMRRPVD